MQENYHLQICLIFRKNLTRGFTHTISRTLFLGGEMASQCHRRKQWFSYCAVPCSFFALCLFLIASPAQAQASSLYELAPAATNKLGRLGFQLKWQAHWYQGNSNYLSGYWDASLARAFSPGQQNLAGVGPSGPDQGLAAVLRYQRNDGTGFYAEAGTGPRYQANSFDLAGRAQGSRLAVNALAGVGFVWKNGVDLGFKAVHVTRGQGKDGNEPSNVVGIDLKYRW
ncbi:hypothetical protein EKL02_17305 [Janthinobacterium sp. 17J80-10]|nr:hypothetical protein EKL02_17305 [Janthinobacterium sp. 17J80-10]